MGIIVTDNNIHIKDSYKYSKKSFNKVFDDLRSEYPHNNVLVNRTNKSLSREWATHNLLYNLHLFRSHTADVDLNYPQKWYMRMLYFIVGSIALILIPRQKNIKH